MAELRIELPTVIGVFASSDACDRVTGPDGVRMLRVSPREVLLVGDAAPTADVGDGIVEDVSDAWVSMVIEGIDAADVVARLSELALPADGWIQGEVARTPAKVHVAPDRITILVPAMLAGHVEERIRADAREVLTS